MIARTGGDPIAVCVHRIGHPILRGERLWVNSGGGCIRKWRVIPCRMLFLAVEKEAEGLLMDC
ncbi:MAG: hypothetical protein Q8O57_11400 [Kiritimatiellota bacterium]|nr:hypothetical protein [Kiritimatiellota bacterium]